MITTDQLNLDILDSNLNYSLFRCDYCRGIFHSKRRNKYCSNSCRQRAYYVRNGLRKDTRKDNLSTNFSSSNGVTLGTYKSKNNIPMDQNHHTGELKKQWKNYYRKKMIIKD